MVALITVTNIVCGLFAYIILAAIFRGWLYVKYPCVDDRSSPIGDFATWFWPVTIAALMIGWAFYYPCVWGCRFGDWLARLGTPHMNYRPNYKSDDGTEP